MQHVIGGKVPLHRRTWAMCELVKLEQGKREIVDIRGLCFLLPLLLFR